MKNASVKSFSREQWKAACTFHQKDSKELVSHLKAQIDLFRREGLAPSILLDLDSTLFEVSPRTHRILQEAGKKMRRKLPKSVSTALMEIQADQVGYSIQDTLTNLGFAEDAISSQAERKLSEFWEPRFFSNPYLIHDRPYKGASEFVQGLHRYGAHIVYLTGRHRREMEKGTRHNLLRDGFPLEDKTELHLKPSREMDDVEFKTEIALKVNETRPIVASFENEPRNIAGLMRVLPDALHVFVDTVCSTKPAQAVKGLVRLDGFPEIPKARLLTLR